MNNKQNSKHIVIEGGEGVGKSTLLNLIKKEFPSDLFVKEPTFKEEDEQVFQKWRQGELDLDEIEEVNLFASGRAHLMKEKVRPALAEDRRVWQDRSILSNLVYQGVRFGLSRNEIIGLNKKIDPDFALPDVVVLLDADPLYIRDRLLKSGRELDALDSAPLHFHQQIRESFLDNLATLPVKGLILNALDSPENNLERVKDFLSKD